MLSTARYAIVLYGPPASAVTSQNLKRDVASQFDRRRDPSREEVQIGIAAPRQITDRVITRPVYKVARPRDCADVPYPFEIFERRIVEVVGYA